MEEIEESGNGLVFESVGNIFFKGELACWKIQYIEVNGGQSVIQRLVCKQIIGPITPSGLYARTACVFDQLIWLV